MTPLPGPPISVTISDKARALEGGEILASLGSLSTLLFPWLPVPTCVRRPKLPGCWRRRGDLVSPSIHAVVLAASCRIFGITLGRLDTHLNGFPLRLTLSLFRVFFCQSQDRGKKRERNHTSAAIVWKRGAAEREGHLLPGWLSFTKWRCYFCVWKWDSTAADSGLHYSAPGLFFFWFPLSVASPSHCSSAPET